MLEVIFLNFTVSIQSFCVFPCVVNAKIAEGNTFLPLCNPILLVKLSNNICYLEVLLVSQFVNIISILYLQ